MKSSGSPDRHSDSGKIAPRTVGGLVLLAVAGWALVAVFVPDGGPAQPVRGFESSQDCAECHPRVFAEWASSQHAESWNNPDVRALSNDFANTDCIDCHAPRPVFETGVGKRVLPRSARRAEGVDCIACHALPQGGVAGTIEKRSAACRPIGTIELQRADFCGVCHDQHKTVQQWLASDYPEQGVSCIDCHMPHRDGDVNRGRDHRCLGGHDLKTVRSAVTLAGGRTDGRWVVTVENSGAGHDFPTDERSRAADVFWRPLAASGADPEEWRHLYRFRDPYRHEVDLPKTLLAAHAVKELAIEAPEGRDAVEVALFYKRSPYWSDPEHPDPEGEAELVQRIELRP